MNKSAIKTYAVWARTELIKLVLNTHKPQVSKN